MIEYNEKSKLWICDPCPASNGESCGPWTEDPVIFPRCKAMHQHHIGWKVLTNEEYHWLLQKNNPFQNSVDTVIGSITVAEQLANKRGKIKGTPIQQIESYLDVIIADDHQLAKKILTTALSAYSHDPVNLAIMAPTSEGKTYTAVKVCETFPKEDVIFIGRMSPAALVHDKGILVDVNNVSIEEHLERLRTEQPEDMKEAIRKLLENSKKLVDLSGKILLFLDSPHPELWERLKPILSHDKYEIEFKIVEKAFGGFKTANIVIRGWPACIFCSARNERRSDFWGEIETRFVTSNPNMNTIKYKKANILTGMRKGLPGFAHSMICDPDDKKFAQFYVKEIRDSIKRFSGKGRNPTWNPFHKIISEAFPSNEGITMRNYNRFTSFCNIETLINSAKNLKIEFRKNDGSVEFYVITSLDDIAAAIEIMGVDTPIPDDKLKFLEKVFMPASKELLDDKLTTSILSEKYTQVYGKPTTPKKILETYLYPLKDYGLIDYKSDPDDKRQKFYRLVAKPGASTLDYIKSRIIEESKNDPLYVWTGILELEKYSINEGRIHAILDPQGNAVGHNLVQKTLVNTETESNNFQEIEA